MGCIRITCACLQMLRAVMQQIIALRSQRDKVYIATLHNALLHVLLLLSGVVCITELLQ